MNKPKNKKLPLITAFLILTIAASFIAILPQTAAQTTNYRSFVYVGCSPKVVGVGQEVIVVTWTADMPPDVGEQNLEIPSPNGRAAWNNPMIVYITKPDGTNDTLSMPRTDPVGATWAIYTPLTAGNYTLQCYFPGETKKSATIDRYYEPDWSPVATLTVTEEPQPVWVETPLTNDYWTRPINTANHEWYVLAGNWLGGAAQNYPRGTAGMTTNYAGGKGTESPHILWTRQYYAGGYGEDTYETMGLQTQHYQGIGWSGLALNGQLHYSPRFTAHGTKGWEIVDLYTGELLSRDYNASLPSFGQVYNYESPNQHGGFTYLYRSISSSALPEIIQVPNVKQFANGSVIYMGTGSGVTRSINRTATTNQFGTIWEMLDGYTMQTVCYIANVSSGGTAVYGKDGSILRYSATNYGNTTHPDYRLSVWNASAGTMVSSQLGTGYWQWRPAGGTFGGTPAYLGALAYNYVHDGNVFWSLINVTIPSLLGARNAISNQTASLSVIKQDEYAVFTAAGFNNGTHTVPGFVIKISLEPGRVGTQLLRQEFTPPSSADGETVSLTGTYPEDNMICFHKTRTLERFGYSMETGQLVWKSEPETQFMYYGMSSAYFNHTLYSHGYGGIITAYDVKTGKVKWTYEPLSIGTESAYGGVYTLGIVLFSDGKLYTVSGEHSPTQPLYRGPNLRCLNAETGEEIWKILGFFGGMSPTSSNIIMGDGILVGLNYFDMQLYAFGRGPSATTVEAENSVSVNGQKVLLKGTVTDQTPYGKRDTNNVLVSSLKGTPAISDEDMQAWMEYKFMQQAFPANAKGVEVELNAIDPNGNYVPIGKTTSDAQGNYGISFVPEVPGDYQIIASFAGSKAYGPSKATTYITVEPAPEATAEPTAQPQLLSETYFVPAIAGLFILIVVVAVVLALMIRKRP
ncbi:MAG: PQQ-binding-like beta-propeller repeat protein [Candidatus Bathyarchaeota archaeon]|nr:PQQ-binding-like beta-propeller repeat protein [Candidatus Bathyarchaeota archaeon]